MDEYMRLNNRRGLEEEDNKILQISLSINSLCLESFEIKLLQRERKKERERGRSCNYRKLWTLI